MVEVNSVQKPQFTTLIYETKDGEKISATKKDGIVTLVGDKNGVRQMPLDKFMTEELPNVKSLEKAPEKDTVEISKTDSTTPIANQTPVQQTAVPQVVSPTIEQKNETVPKKLDVVA